jgi:hypothetical protein
MHLKRKWVIELILKEKVRTQVQAPVEKEHMNTLGKIYTD